MNNPNVRNWMTPNPITITTQTTLPEARQLMDEYYIRRLPVVKKDKLVGIVTRGGIREAQSSQARTLGVSEMNFLLDRLTAKEFMAYEPITIWPDAAIGEAARLMLQHKIGGLPVVEDCGLVGIITETDLCRFLMLQADSPTESDPSRDQERIAITTIADWA